MFLDLDHLDRVQMVSFESRDDLVAAFEEALRQPRERRRAAAESIRVF